MSNTGKAVPSLEGVTPKTWEDYDPSKLGHIARSGSSPIREATARKGDLLVVTESGCMDLVEVLENDLEKYEVYLAYHTSFGRPLPKPQLFVYDYKPGDGMGRAMVGQWLRVFEINDIPSRYIDQVQGEEKFLPQEKYL